METYWLAGLTAAVGWLILRDLLRVRNPQDRPPYPGTEDEDL